MRTGMKSPPNGANILVAREVFKHDVLRILISEFDGAWQRTRLDIKVRCCIDATSVIITSADPSRGTDSVT